MRTLTRSRLLGPLVVLAALALTACSPIPVDGDGIDEPLPVETGTFPTETETAPPVDDDFFLRITATMTEVSGEQLTGVLTVFEPEPEADTADVRSTLESGCEFYNAVRADDDTTAADAPYFGAATLTVTGQSTWNDDHGVRIETGGYASLGTGTANRVDLETCTNLLHSAGTSTFATYFPLNHAEGAIEGAIQWSYFGFGDLGDAGGVTYSGCSIELSPHAQDIRDASDSGWAPHPDACFIGPFIF